MSGICGAFKFEDRPEAEAGYTIWTDARLDYRGDLMGALGISPGATASDADLILAAYQKWGESCVDHLLGDFAFAIHDSRSNTLFCARDHFGMRPFYYHYSNSRLVFASDARLILADQQVPFAINEARIADFLVPELEWADYTSTFYDGIYRLPPGHTLIVNQAGLKLSEYWQPEPGPHLGPMSDHDWCDGFLEVFTHAVDTRLCSTHGLTGAMLSGGMDSGSVVAVANGLLHDRGESLRTWSVVQNGSVECAESQRIRATLRHIGIAGTTIEPGSAENLDGELVRSIEEPFDAEYLFLKAIYQTAAQDGVQTMLDGGGGDVLLNEGSYLTRLLRHGRLPTAFQELRKSPRFWGGSVTREVLRCSASALVPAFAKSRVRPYRLRNAGRGFVNASIIHAEFARSVDIESRCQQMFDMFPMDWTSYEQERIRKIRPNVTAGRERYARLAASAGIEARDPFLDRRVVDFCSRLPGRMLLRNGWPKWILREAMAGLLPDEVRWGLGKPHIGWMYNQAFLQRRLDAGELDIGQIEDTLGSFVDSEKLRRAWREFVATGVSEITHSAYILSLWLQQNATRPVVNDQGFSYSSRTVGRGPNHRP